MKQFLKTRSIAFRLALMILIVNIVVESVFGIYSFDYAKNIILGDARELGKQTVIAELHEIETRLQPTMNVAQAIKALVEEGSFSEENLTSAVQVFLSLPSNQDIQAIGMVHHNPDGKTLHEVVYRLEKGHLQKESHTLSRESATQMNAIHLLPKGKEGAHWSEPEFHDDNTVSAYYTLGVKEEDEMHRFIDGNVYVKIDTSWVDEIGKSYHENIDSRFFVLTHTGHFLTLDGQAQAVKDDVFTYTKKHDLPEIAQIAQKMLKGEKGEMEISRYTDGKAYLAYYDDIPHVGWSYCALLPQEQIYKRFEGFSKNSTYMAIIELFVMVTILFILVQRFARPLNTLSQTAYKIAEGNLDQKLPDYDYQDEIGRLRQAFSDMQVILKKYINDLTASTAAQERIQSELDIAKNIQLGILEKDFPDIHFFGLHAHMQAAKEVGGDFYDFFYLDEKTLAIVIGDVSGKGVPAALFMALTKTLVKARSTRGADAGTIITWVNDELCSKNDSSMFVTLFMGILDLDSGEMRYCNAGHNFPCIKHGDGKVSWVSTAQVQPALGFMDGIPYKGEVLKLEPEEMFVLYTDGVTEAFNAEGEMYGDDKLLQTLEKLSGKASSVANGLLEDVKSFAGEAPQSDDITILALTYHGDRVSL